MFEIIPTIDIIDGKCVRLTQGDYGQKKEYAASPLETAKRFEQAGIKRLHLVDLDGARLGKITNLSVLKEIASKTSLKIDFGGGIKTTEDMEQVLNNGAAMATIGSLAVKSPELFKQFINFYGADKIFLGCDVKNEKIAINGWLENTEISIYTHIEKNLALGVTAFFCTDISKDGLLQGPAINLYQKILKKFPGISLTASGGVSSLDDIKQLKDIGCSGVIVGKAIYEGRVRLDDMTALSLS